MENEGVTGIHSVMAVGHFLALIKLVAFFEAERHIETIDYRILKLFCYNLGWSETPVATRTCFLVLKMRSTGENIMNTWAAFSYLL